ncbi:hypothetical protein HGP28_09005 [Vibrio sp. SM6]|uniref:Uncharacterized protein n=1 Tax=Vibrio agarilyticus TaxID=2726741 RepID=A0A7X8TQE0_9VIBR|nr:hypothetical protein [Vibrio agarilyticus]NLS13025.1 hypothetical protein [Vibrio agarilyticus]
MIPLLLNNLAPMLFGAQLILTLVLVKGDICPGQRGRIHKLFPALSILWLAVASLKIEAFMIVFALFYFYSKVQTGKTREKGPLWLLHLANGLAFSYLMIQAFEQSSFAASIATLLLSVFIGGLFAQLLLTVARSRLQAFNKILPVAGVIGAMGLVLALMAVMYRLDEAVIAQQTHSIIALFLLLILAIVAWCWHMLTHKAATKLQLGIALFLALFASTGIQFLFQLTGALNAA